MSYQNPDDAGLRELLGSVRQIAVVGASPNPARPANQVMRYLSEVGYQVTPVRPGGGAVLGLPTVPSLSAWAGSPPDLVNVFRAPEHALGIARAALNLGVKALWFQEGVVCEAAARVAAEAGLWVVMDRCILRDHRRVCG